MKKYHDQNRSAAAFAPPGSSIRGVPAKDVQAFPDEPAGPLGKYREHAGMQSQQGRDIVQRTPDELLTSQTFKSVVAFM